VSFALFMGVAMSITAFPVLARILEDRGLTKTFLGSTAITARPVGRDGMDNPGVCGGLGEGGRHGVGGDDLRAGGGVLALMFLQCNRA